MQILALYRRRTGSGDEETQLQPGDELHVFNGELFIVRKEGQGLSTLRIQYKNGSKNIHTVDGIPVQSESDAAYVLEALLGFSPVESYCTQSLSFSGAPGKTETFCVFLGAHDVPPDYFFNPKG